MTGIPKPDTAATDWQRIDLGPYLRGEMPDVPAPSVLELPDRGALFYPAKLHLVSGEPEGLKSWLLQVAAAEVLRAGENVLYIDHEKYPGDIAERFLALGLSPELLEQRLIYVRPESPPSDAARTQLRELATTAQPGLTAVDGIGMAMGAAGLDPHSGGDYLHWLTTEVKPLQTLTPGPTVMTDHVPKGAEENPTNRYSAGSYQKLAQVDVHIGVRCVKKFGRGLNGRALLKLHKDTPGWLRRIERDGAIATLALSSDENTGEVVYTLDETSASPGTFRPTTIMAHISEFLERQQDKTASKNLIEEAMQNKREHVRAALACLVDEGYVDVVLGPNRAKLHVSKQRFYGTEPPPSNGHHEGASV